MFPHPDFHTPVPDSMIASPVEFLLITVSCTNTGTNALRCNLRKESPFSMLCTISHRFSARIWAIFRWNSNHTTYLQFPSAGRSWSAPTWFRFDRVFSCFSKEINSHKIPFPVRRCWLLPNWLVWSVSPSLSLSSTHSLSLCWFWLPILLRDWSGILDSTTGSKQQNSTNTTMQENFTREGSRKSLFAGAGVKRGTGY